MIQRVRSKAFGSLLRQEVAYFDRTENSSGAICVRLSSDASALQEMAGTRLGVICEAIAISLFGVLFGLAFNWQLTVIVVLPMISFTIFTLADIRLNRWIRKQSSRISEKMNSVRSNVSSSHWCLVSDSIKTLSADFSFRWK